MHEVQIKVIAFLIFSSFKRKFELKGFNIAWYLSTAITERVKAHEAIAILPAATNLQENLLTFSSGHPQ